MPEPNHQEEMKRICQILLIVVFVCSIVGCRSHSVAVSESVRITDSVRWETRYRDSVVIMKVERDSVRIKDSVLVVIDSLGNKTTDRWHTFIQYRTDASEIARYAAKIDSLTRVKQKDSVRIVEKTVQPSKLQRLELSVLRGFAIVSIIVILGMILLRKVR